MTKQKDEQVWEILENGKVIKTGLSHTKAKNMVWKLEKETKEDWLDLSYELRRIK